MARIVNPALKKLVIIFLILGAFAVAYRFSKKAGIIDKIAPKGKDVSMTSEAKKAAKAGTPILRVGLNTWGGNVPGPYYNGGFAASTESRYYKEHGILVQFTLDDDLESLRNAWKVGEIDVMGLVTIDSFVTEVDALKELKPEVFIQIDYSRGGDAVVAVKGISSPKDARGKKVAFAEYSPSQSLLMLWLEAGGDSYNEIKPVPTKSALDAASQFKAGAVDIAVVWSPDDEDCAKAVPGAKIVFNTRQAAYAIADVLVDKYEFLKKNKETIDRFAEGWLTAVKEINTDLAARSKAEQIMVDNFKVDAAMAKLMIDNARLSTYGDNLNFFGLGSPKAVKGQEIYEKMHAKFRAIGLAPDVIPAWREITDTSVIRSISLNGPGDEAEGAKKS